MKARSLFPLSASLLLCLLSGCTTTSDPTRSTLDSADKLASEQKVPDGLKPYYQRLYWEGKTHATLNRMRLASAAIEEGAWENAEHALDEVIRDIEALGPADPRSREALSKFEAEEIKRFKGEPYERAMAYFLRGLLYLRSKEWENARACFKSVQLQDATQTDPNLRGYWASADWLEGWCNWNLGETSAAQECWQRTAKLRKISSPAPEDNTLVVALLGFGPTKIPAGNFGEQLSYRKGDSQSTQARLKTDTSFVSLLFAEDIFNQAKSRGLRVMDVVNQGKAGTRAATETAGDTLIYGGSGATIGGSAAGDTTVAAAGLGAVAAGILTKSVASSIKPKADTRSWDLLPATILLLPIHISPADHNLEFQFLDPNRKIVAERKVEVRNDSQPQLILITQR